MAAAACSCERGLRQLFARPGATDGEAATVVGFALMNMVGCASGAYMAGRRVMFDAGEYPLVLVVAGAAWVAVCVGVLLCLACTRRVTSRLIGCTVVASGAAVAVLDVVGMGHFTRYWPLFVVLCDALLVLKAPSWMAAALVMYVVVHLGITQAEYDFRFGLLDLPGFEYDRRGMLVPYLECENPPCATGQGFRIMAFFHASGVFYLDFYFTRGFAAALQKEKATMEASIALSERVAACLARFDLAAAEVHLAGAAELPGGLRESYRELLLHLAAYRPYLPQCVLPCSGGEAPSDESDGSSAYSPLSGAGSFADSAFSSNSSTSRSASSVIERSATMRGVRLGLKATRCTLLHLEAALASNLDPGSLGDGDFMPLHRAFVSAVVTTASACGGIVDSFTAGAAAVSFNASRLCVQHCKGAAAAAKMMAPALAEARVAWGGGIASGAAFVGMLGTATLRRPAVVGPVAEAVEQAARVAERAGDVWLCTRAVYADQCAVHELRIWLHWVHFAAPAAQKNQEGHGGLALYQLLQREVEARHPDADKASEASEGGGGEWMYLIDNAGARWDAYNAAGRVFLEGAPEDARALLRHHGAPAATVAAFEAAAAAAEVVAFFPRVGTPACAL